MSLQTLVRFVGRPELPRRVQVARAGRARVRRSRHIKLFYRGKNARIILIKLGPRRVRARVQPRIGALAVDAESGVLSL